MQRFTRLRALIAVTILTACEDVQSPSEPTDAATMADAGADGAPDAGTEADARADAAGREPDASPDAGSCVPERCPANACGAFDDGCGTMIQCTDGCACTDFLSDCPQLPCERAVGCEAGRCAYAPTTCSDAACRCPGAECDEATPRPCGEEACPAQFCDSAPYLEGATLRYANACIADVTAPCGTCDLGLRACDPETSDPETSVICRDVPLPGVDPALVECDSTRATSTFVFVDDEYPGADADGSRERPFADLEAALTAAAQRNARAVVVSGSPVIEGPLVLRDGISILGGYARRPSYQRDPLRRPRWVVGAEHVADGRLVGVEAIDITQATVLQGIAVETGSLADQPRAGPGAVNHAVLAVRAPGLLVVDVVAVAGDAGHGGNGARGADAPRAGEHVRGAPPGGETDPDRLAHDAWLGVSRDAACADLPPAPFPPGLGGTPTLCPGDEPQPPLAGGSGGQSSLPPAAGAAWIAEPGEAGADGTPGGVAGDCHDRICDGANGAPVDGEAPPAGASGTDAVPLHLEDGRFVPRGKGARGLRGTSGHPGGGGAAGSGYAGQIAGATRDVSGWLCGRGLAGSGGGAGGCGGEGGEGGHPGGFSFGLLVADSPGLRVEGGSYTAGRGGDGGAGARGGRGNEGGPGAEATTISRNAYRAAIESLLCDPAEPDLERRARCQQEVDTYLRAWEEAARPGAGGHGSHGGTGATGGAGAGGSSIAIYCHGAGAQVIGAIGLPGAPGAGGTPDAIERTGCE